MKDQDPLLQEARAALRKLRPKVRKIGLVDAAGSVEYTHVERLPDAPNQTAKVVRLTRKGDL